MRNYVWGCGVSVTDETYTDVRMHDTRQKVRIRSTLIYAGHCGYCFKRIAVPGVLCHSLTELTEVPGKGLGSYIISRTSGYGYGSLTELSEFPGIVARAHRTHRSSGRVQNMPYPYPGVLWQRAYRTCISSL